VSQDVSILDFGSGKITVLIGRRGINNTIVLSGIGESEYAGLSHGAFVNPENLSLAVAHAIRCAETSARTVIKHLTIGVPGEFSACWCSDVQQALGKKRKIIEEDLSNLHEHGNEFKNHPDYLLINSQPVYYTLDDGRRLIQPEGLSSITLGGHISYILAKRDFISTVDALMQELNIVSHSYMSSLVAESMFLFDDTERDRYVVFIDSGSNTTNVVVARGDGILAQYNLPLGGAHLTAGLAYEFKSSFTHAEALKRKINLSLNVGEADVYTITTNRSDTLQFNAKKANDTIKALIKAMADTITAALKKCPYDYPDYIPYYLTGGALAYIKGADALLSKYLKRPVEIIAPNLPQSNRPHLSSSLGLLDMALRMAPPEETKPVGLLKKLFRSKKRGGNS